MYVDFLPEYVSMFYWECVSTFYVYNKDETISCQRDL